MKASIEPIDSVSKKVIVTLEAAVCAETKASVLSKIQAQASLPGFRKGKVPVSLLMQHYGENVKLEVRQALLDKILQYLRDEEKLDVASLLKIDFQDKEGDEQEATLEVELVPEITLPDYKNFKLEECKIEITDAEIDETIDQIRKQQASYEVVDRPANDKDYVKLNYAGFYNDQPVDNFENVPYLWKQQKNTWEEIRHQEDINIPEMVEGLKGMKAGDKKSIEVTFPKTFAVAELAEKKARYDLEVLEVREVKLPELNEAFFKNQKVENLETLKNNIRTNLEAQKKQEYASYQKQRIADFLIHSVTQEMPQAWVEKNTGIILQEMVNVFAAQGIKKNVLQDQKDAMIERAKSLALDRTKLNLCFEKIAKEENVKMENRDFEMVIYNEAMRRRITPQKLLQLIKGDAEERRDIHEKAFQAKMINWLFDLLNKAQNKD